MLSVLGKLLGKVGLDKIGDALDAVFTSDEEKQNWLSKARELDETARKSNLEILLDSDKQQSAINRIDQMSRSKYQAGWRPLVGWVCASSFAWQYLVSDISTYILAAAGHDWTPPVFLGAETMTTVLMGMLGLGALRTIEKAKGVTT